MTLAIAPRARHFPGRTAVVDATDDVTCSYGDLDRRRRAAAARLAERGVGPGDVVAAIAPNRIEHLSLLYATRHLDATLAPISHRLAAETVVTLVDHLDPRIVLLEERFEDLTDASATPIAPIDRIDRSDGAPEAPEATDGDAPAMYLHTGGTTGVPKLVEITDRQLEWNAITEVAAWGLGKHDVCPVVLPLFHTGGWNLLTLPTLYVGARVVLQRSFDPGGVLDIVETHGATRLFGVAAIFQAIADHDDFDATDLSSLEWCMSGGGPTPVDLMETYRARGVAFTQGYGLTEGGPNNLYVDPDREDAHKADECVGRPFPDCEVRVVDEAGSSVPTGTIGELELRGPVTADRYLTVEDGTFDGDWVSTGDLASIDADGDVTIEGRVDNMFVSGGENVYPEAIEGVLERHPAVARAGVIPIDDERWGQVPVAVIEPTEAGAPAPEELEALAEEHMPGYTVPTAFTVVEELSLSGPGKLDREALRDRI